MNLSLDHDDAGTFEPIRRQRRFTFGRTRTQATGSSGIHRRHRRHWRPASKAALAAHAR
jgi:hypothetical protein